MFLSPEVLKVTDTVCQAAVFILGPTAIFLTGKKDRRGFVVGLVSQPFWFITTIINQQWVLIALNVIYTANWSYGVYNWYWKKDPKDQTSL